MGAENDAETTVTDLPDEGRFELRVGDEVAGWVDYRPGGRSVIIAHTEVSDDYAGRGLAAVLMGEVLAQLRAQGRTVIPVCPFAASYIRRHPEHADDVDPSLRSQYAAGA